MGTVDKWIDVEVIFMLGIKNPQDQVPLLSSIMEKIYGSRLCGTNKRNK